MKLWLKMTNSAVLSSSFLLIVAVLLGLLLWQVRRNDQSHNFMMSLYRSETARVQTLINLALTKDFQTFAGMQSLTQNQSASGLNPQSSPTSASEYIPRDDATEALRIKNFGGTIGYGETIFYEDDDEELAQVISEMVSSGQIDFGEET